jgi:hypothetical protein
MNNKNADVIFRMTAQSARTSVRRLRIAAMAGLMAVLSACGGGGGGSSQPSVPPGTFTLSSSSASFDEVVGSSPPQAQTATITITGPNAAYAGAAYPSGQSQPSWLGVSITGSGTVFTLAVTVYPGAVPAGTYTTTFDVGTADSAGNVLTYKPFTVNLTLEPRIAIGNSPAAATFAFGDNPITQALPVSVTAPNRALSITSDAAWLHVPMGSTTGGGTVNAVIDATGVAPGNYIGHITVAETQDSTDNASLTVTLTVTPAALTVTEGSFVFGGTDGLAALTPLPVDFSLSTGHASYPYTVALTTMNGGNWLKVDSASGMVGAAGTTVHLSVDRTGLKGGTYTGQITISSQVAGTTFQQVLPVTLNIEANRLVATALGVGFSSIAGQSVLTRTVQVLSATGRTDVPWNASSDSSWLSVTPSGTTGGNLVLTANTSGIPLNATQFANVTITSSDTSVENSQTIRVGLYVSNTAAVSTGLSLSANSLAASPVEPIVAVGTYGTSVGIYDVNSGALLRTLSGVAATSGELLFSEDGTTLFVLDTTNMKVTAVNPTSGAIGTVYDASVQASFGAAGTGIAVMHPNGYTMLFTPNGHAYDLATGAALPSSSDLAGVLMSEGYAVSPDQTLLAGVIGYASRIVRSALNGGSLVITRNVLTPNTAIGADGQSCFSANGDRIYTAAGYPYDFPATSVTTGQLVQTLPGTNYPDSMVCVWNGIVIGGVDGFYATGGDIFVYYGPTGVSLGMLSSFGTTPGNHDLLARGLVVSADGTRIISTWANNPTSLPGGVNFQSLPPPPP